MKHCKYFYKIISGFYPSAIQFRNHLTCSWIWSRELPTTILIYFKINEDDHSMNEDFKNTHSLSSKT